jgi:hypothetical protein
MLHRRIYGDQLVREQRFSVIYGNIGKP